MKRQYLGDSKDSFKWDYHHFLVKALGYRQLQVVWMMTPDDHGPDGRTHPELFPANPEILKFCNKLKKRRDPGVVADLPTTTAASYKVVLYKSEENLARTTRRIYFADLSHGPNQVILLDPDNGFEPERRFTEKHIRYDEVEGILKKATPSSVVTVFQHFRRVSFPDDLARIRQRLHSGHSTAIYWHSLMFVCISTSLETITRVQEVNLKYAKDRPVKVIH